MIISASKLKTYSSCGRKYYYQYKEKAASEKTIPLIMGTSVHKAIEEGYRGKHPELVYTQTWQKEIADNNLEHNAKAFSKGMRMVLQYDFSIVPDFIEQYFEMPFPNKENPIAVVNGYIDQGFEWGVRDLKTSARKPDQLLLDYDLQFILYAWAFEQFTGTKPKQLVWHHLDTGEDMVANVLGEEKLEHAIESIMSLVKADADETFPRHVGFECGWCPFKKVCLGGGTHDVGNS